LAKRKIEKSLTSAEGKRSGKKRLGDD